MCALIYLKEHFQQAYVDAFFCKCEYLLKKIWQVHISYGSNR